MATCFGLFETNNEVTGADIAAMPAYMSTAIAAAHGYTATIVTNANSDAIYAYVARMLPTQLTAQIAAIDASLARQQTGISAIIAARTSGAGAGLTKTLADLDAALTAANEAATLDDPVAIAAAGRDAAAAVAAAWQEVNNINARAAETFAGLGPGSFAMSVAGFMGWAGEWGDIIWAGIGGAGHGLAMFANAATWHLTPLDGYVDGLIAENGGMYGTANFFAHVSAFAAEAAVIIAAAPLTFTLPTLSIAPVMVGDGVLGLVTTVGTTTVTIGGSQALTAAGLVGGSVFMARKWDQAQVDEAARQAGVDRNAFSDYIHEVKYSIDRGGADNFTFRQLLDLAYEFLDFFGGA